jgi:tetratricopeptide (TPR) repeat protein
MSHNHLFEPRNEAILFKILGMIDDPSDLIRLTVWRLIESKINLSYKRYLPLVNKIIVLATDKNLQKRKEAIHFIKTHLNIFNPIIEAYPQPTKVKHIFGTIYSENGDLERALSFFNKIVKADPSELDSWLAIALSHLQYGDPNQAIQTLDVAKKVNRFDFRIHEIYAECLSELQQEASAEKFRDIAKILKAREVISINRDKWD